MATQNPIESEGTYPLPEAQLDRFMMKIVVTYPAFNDEIVVVQRSLDDLPHAQNVLTTAELRCCRRQRRRPLSTGW
jgi:MoxR-like ATPase